MRRLAKLIAVVAVITLVAGMAAGCGTDPEEDAIKQVIVDQIEYLRDEDVEGVLSTMHPESPQLATTSAILEQVFELYDLEYRLKDIDVVEISKNEAKLRVVQETRKVNGPELADTRVTAIHTIRKTDGGWKLYESVTESSEPLTDGE